MSAKDILGSKPSKKPKITKVSGYVDTPTPKKCATCEYIVKNRLCKNKIVAKDKQVKTDKSSGLKIVDSQNGCCNYWQPKD